MARKQWQRQRDHDRLEATRLHLAGQERRGQGNGAEGDLQIRQQEAAAQAQRADDLQSQFGELATKARKLAMDAVDRLRQIAELVHQGAMAIIRNL